MPAIDGSAGGTEDRGHLEPASFDKMKVGDSDFTPQMLRAKDGGADTILSFSNAVEMANALKAGNKIGYKPKVLSAWGLANPTFPSLAGPLSDGVLVMQTFTFVQNANPKAAALFKRLTEKYKDVKDATAVPFPSYIGNAYDATHMIALAIKKAGGTEGPKLQSALESLGAYNGLMKSYANRFSADRHEALGPDDYSMTVWQGTRLELIV